MSAVHLRRSFRARAHAPRASVLFTTILAALAGCASTDEAPASDTAPQTAARAEVAERLLADVAWLADDAREGRRAGTPGEAAAARYIQARFAELRLTPAGTDGSYLQPFEVPLPPRDGGGSSLGWEDGASADAEHLRPLFCSEAGSVVGALTFCGYGIADERLGTDQFPAEPTGGVALIVRGVPAFPPAESTGSARVPFAPDSHAEDPEAPPTTWGGAGSIFLKVMNAKRAGFDAVLLAQHPGDPSAVPAFDPGQAAMAGIPAVAISAGLAERVFPGYAARVEEADSEKRVDAAFAAGGSIAVNADVRRETATATNVLGLIPGRDRGRAVVVGAHFDHLGRGGPGSLAPNDLGEIHNGADDNASGTAVVLELARRWAGATPPHTILFALWSGEELGLLGSEHWASHPATVADARVPVERVIANINLDMVGRAGDGELSVLGAGSSPDFAAWLAEAGPRAGLDLAVSLSGQGLGGSDHQIFLRRGIPVMNLFSGVHSDYHRPSDDVEGFEAYGAAQVTDLADDLVHRLLAADAVPFVEPPADDAATVSRERGWSVWFGTVPEYGSDVKGLLLSGTSAGSPAEKAGLLAGDIIVQVGDVEITTIHDFVYMLQVYKPGDVVLTRYLRGGEPREVRMTLSTRALE